MSRTADVETYEYAKELVTRAVVAYAGGDRISSDPYICTLSLALYIANVDLEAWELLPRDYRNECLRQAREYICRAFAATKAVHLFREQAA